MCNTILKTYPWLTRAFLAKKVQNYEGGRLITLKTFEVSNAIPKGENFLSNIIRIKVKYYLDAVDSIEKELSFILKAPLQNDEFDRGSSDDFNFFIREIYTYAHIITRVENLLCSAGIHGKLAPRYYNDEDDAGFLLFEDLIASGYQLTDRRIGLDFRHLDLAMKKLARWHAATAVLGAKSPDLFLHIKPLASAGNSFTSNYVENAVEAASRASREWPGFEKISAILSSCKHKIFEKMCENFIYNPDGFNVFSHGDSWANNIMYKYKDSELIDVVFVDYSFGCWGAVGRDLSYILFSSSARSVNERDWDILLQRYHMELRFVLQQLNYPKEIPSLNDIHLSFLQNSILSAVVGMSIAACRFVETFDKDGLESFIGQDESDKEFLYKMYSNPASLDVIKFLLNYYERKGILQF